MRIYLYLFIMIILGVLHRHTRQILQRYKIGTEIMEAPVALMLIGTFLHIGDITFPILNILIIYLKY